MTKETSSKTMVHGKYNQQRTTSQEAEIIIQISPSPLLVAKIYNEKKNFYYNNIQYFENE